MRTRLQRRRVFVIAALALATATALTGCVGPIGQKGGSAGDEAALTFVGGQPDGYYDKVISAFEKENKGITVKYVANPASQLSQVLQARLGTKDSSIDVFTADEPKIPSMVQKGFMEPLGDLEGEAKKALTPESVAASSFNGKLYALPLWTSTMLLYYNTALLQKAGIAAPSVEPAKRLTWEQLVDDAKKTQAAGAQFGFAFEQPGRYYQLEPLIVSAGGSTGLSGKGNLTPNIVDDGWKKALGFYQSLFAEGVTPKGIQYTQLPSLFAGGKIAYFLGNTPNIVQFQKNSELKFGIAPSPYFAGGKPETPTDSWALAVSPYSKHIAEAKKFIEFMALDSKGAELSGQDIARIPSNKDAYAYWAKLIDAAAPSLSQASSLIAHELKDTAVERPRSVGYIDFEADVNTMIDDIGNGSSVDTALQSTEAELKNALSRFQ